MLDLLKQKMMVTNDGLAVHERPAVVEAKRKLEETRATWVQARTELDKIERVLRPITETSSSRPDHADRIAMSRARAAYPEAELVFWEAEGAFRTAEQVFQETLKEETQALTLVRAEARRGLVQQLFAKLDEAKAVAEEIAGYDLETTALGGTAQLHPFGELLDEPLRTGSVTFRRQLLEKEGAL